MREPTPSSTPFSATKSHFLQRKWLGWGEDLLDLYACLMYSVTMNTQPHKPTIKNNRIATRVTDEHKALCERAASLRGLSLTDFIINSAYDAAIKTLRDSEYVLDLFPDDARVFVENLVKPLESPEKEAPRLYQAVMRNNL